MSEHEQEAGFWSDSPEFRARDGEVLRRATRGVAARPDPNGELERRLRTIAERRQGREIDPEEESIATLLALAIFGRRS